MKKDINEIVRSMHFADVSPCIVLVVFAVHFQNVLQEIIIFGQEVDKSKDYNVLGVLNYYCDETVCIKKV